MNNKLITQNIDLWEAWVDGQYDEKTPTGTIYVTGDITTSNNIIEPKLIKRRYTDSPYELSLEIVANNISEDGYVMEMFYEEAIADIDQYDTVTIYADNELMVIITDIEKIF